MERRRSQESFVTGTAPASRLICLLAVALPAQVQQSIQPTMNQTAAPAIVRPTAPAASIQSQRCAIATGVNCTCEFLHQTRNKLRIISLSNKILCTISHQLCCNKISIRAYNWAAHFSCQ